MKKSLQISYNDKVIFKHVEIAENFYDRFIGLLLKENLSNEEGLLIKNCSSIHTFFMKFPIDCIFLDDSYQIICVHQNVKPYRIVAPLQSSIKQVLEIKSNHPFTCQLQPGQKLDVTHTP